MRKLLIPLTLLALAGCSLEVVREADATTTTTRPTTTTSSTTTTTTTTVYAPRIPDDFDKDYAEYEASLQYLSDYCYTDCSRVDEATWLNYVDSADGYVLADAVNAMASLTYWQLDDLCDMFWSMSDQAVIDAYFSDYRGRDANAVLAALWYTCDS